MVGRTGSVRPVGSTSCAQATWMRSATTKPAGPKWPQGHLGQSSRLIPSTEYFEQGSPFMVWMTGILRAPGWRRSMGMVGRPGFVSMTPGTSTIRGGRTGSVRPVGSTSCAQATWMRSATTKPAGPKWPRGHLGQSTALISRAVYSEAGAPCLA